MSSEETLIQVRQDKHQQLNGGTYPLATPVCHSSIDGLRRLMAEMVSIKTTINLVDVQDDPQYVVHGRLIAYRKSGGISFLKLTGTTSTIQLIANKSVLPDYDKLPLLDLGDLIEVEGPLVLSKTGEQSILIRRWILLTKAHRPPPEKFFGLTNQETIYRKRYLDLLSSEESRARFMLRSMIVRGLRKIMDGRLFMEVETATLNAISSGANAKPFTTHHNALDTDLFLRIAPELYLKRLLVGGFEKVYEIGRAYRNEGIDTRHNPEFTMMEAYQAYADFPQLLNFTKSLLEDLDSYLESETTGIVRQYFHQWKNERPFTLGEFYQTNMYDAVMNACGKMDIALDCASDQLMGSGCINDDILHVNFNVPGSERQSRVDVKDILRALAEASSPGEKWNVLFEHLAEPFLAEDYRTADGTKSVPVFITEYPRVVSPLARANDRDPSVCDRFELFIEGRELANAFQELNDPKEQAARFQEQLQTNDKDPMLMDSDYVEALEYGMPPAVGLGMGIERLCMLFTNTSNIKDVILFPTLKPHHNNQ